MTENKAEARGFEPTIPLGVFLGTFGLVVAGAALMPMSTSDKIINLGSGALLFLIGAFCVGLGLRHRRKLARAKGKE
jgi:hypothetical protein